ncbi:DNA -binding domain-containing protein [Acidomonas methanolica]|uniref:T6SS Transcription factor RovC-like DNA binding domain-containing protein n=1 Tax=Acidomonas methanolica NBRC 104435 TaxID=1231351 RepID=A0A023D8V4_ACIMT|nr:DUF2285 domain-containing protein [Acidomonas methanolica]MBU2655747.1 DUF2285 domain-containing protein [Acidomonas methanolica]TCS19663.1 uncharacterized protein DUF2285 [Acidomonas methanolica]GAJ30607.1 hypothetical protein Amme_209_003 [Acidomonas methanolica NBRC 104435]GBQ55556.1 hypothetical protein AA0498_2279 [Acidomonas methanolica]GEL00759.1 hypothetical protein AME01nite_32570 [Acidomonas methanolica NBRC 104435]
MPDTYADSHGAPDIAARVASRTLAALTLPDGARRIVTDTLGSQQLHFLPTPSGRHDAYLLPHAGFERHLGALLRFLDLPARGRLAPRHHLTHQTPLHQERLVLMLRVNRAREKGASRREMGAVLFRRRPRARSALEWSGSELRATLYRLNQDALAMVAGGYLDLLGHGLSGKMDIPEA